MQKDHLIHAHGWDDDLNARITEFNNRRYEVVGVYMGPHGDIIVHMAKYIAEAKEAKAHDDNS